MTTARAPWLRRVSGRIASVLAAGEDTDPMAAQLFLAACVLRRPITAAEVHRLGRSADPSPDD
jgi:hypothetical protein